MGPFRAALSYQLQLTVFNPVALAAALLNPLVLAVLIATQAGSMSPRIAIAAGLAGIMETGVLQAIFFVLTERNEGTLVSLALTPAGMRGPLLGRSLGARGVTVADMSDFARVAELLDDDPNGVIVIDVKISREVIADFIAEVLKKQ